LAQLAKNVVRTRIYEAPDKREWVHHSGPMVVVGDAAHKIPVSFE